MHLKIYVTFLLGLKKALQIFGLFPIPMNNYKNLYYSVKTANKNQRIIFWTVFQILILLATWILIAIYEEHIFYAKNSVGIITGTLKISTVSLAYLVTMVELIINREQLKSIHTKIKQFDENCSSLKIDWKKYKNQSDRSFAKFAFFTLALYLAVEIKIVISIGNIEQWCYFWLVSILPITMSRLIYIQFIDYLRIVKMRLTILKDQLIIIVDESKISPLSSSKVKYLANLEKSQTIKDGYGAIWDITDTINDCFAWSMAANVTQNFVQISCDMYWTYVYIYFVQDKIFGIFFLT